MESFRLKSKIVENEKEYLIQTFNDARQGIIKTSVFADGELLDDHVVPHAEELSEELILGMVKSAHGERRAELEYLLKSHHEVMESGQPRMMYHLGVALFHKKLYQEAARLLALAVQLLEDFHEACHVLSQAEMALGKIKMAAEMAEKAVNMRPDFPDYRNNFGEICLASGSTKRAIIEFEEAIKRNVYYADAYFNLGLGHILEAINTESSESRDDVAARILEWFKKAILIYPDYQCSAYEKAREALVGGDYKRAFSLLKGIREEKKEKRRREKAAHFNRFLMYTDWLSENDIADRISTLESEIRKNPDYVDLYHELALCYLHQSKFSWHKGIEYFKKALGINRNPVSYTHLRAHET